MMDKEHECSNSRVLKRSMTGLESEFHIIDGEGRISNRAGEVIDILQQKDPDKSFVTKEIGKSMIEFNAFPDIRTYNPVLDIIGSIQKALEIMDDMDLKLLPMGTYPGKFEPAFNDSPMYDIKKKIFKSEKTKKLAQCVGVHHHYTLPKGVFDSQRKRLKLMKRSKLSRSFINSYNLEIAADPALTLFTQSSPFYQGQQLAKDSRVVVYRGGSKLRYMDGAYARLQQMGGLPPYKQTVTDLLLSQQRRIQRWRGLIRKADPTINFRELYPCELDIGWHPVKINKHETLEYRNMDVNFMSIITGVIVLLKFVLKHIQREFIEVIPADFAMDEPFRREKNVIYIPPHTYVRKILLPRSVYKGYQDIQVYKYAKGFLKPAKTVTPKRYNSIIQPIVEMVEQKKSLSDKILQYANYKGYIKDDQISDTDACQLALYYAKQYPKDLEKTRKKLDRIATL